MTYDATEKSIEDAIRVEIYTFELPTATYRMTKFDEPVAVDGFTYAPDQIDRGPVPLVPLGRVRELTVSLALDHPLAIALRQEGIPPRDARVTIRWFFFGNSTESRLIWQGFIGGISTDDQYARLQVPNRLDEAFDCQLPALTAQRECPHILYDRGCGVIASPSFVVLSTVAAANGTALSVASIGGKPNGWATFGKVVRLIDGEQRSIIDQTGTSLVLDVPFSVIAFGDEVEVYAGCDHTIDGLNGCVEKFSNALNFGGDPYMPTGNPTAPTGYGVAVQV